MHTHPAPKCARLALAPLAAFLLLAGALAAQEPASVAEQEPRRAPDLGDSDFYLLNFPTQSGERLTLDTFLRLAEEATGQNFARAPEVQRGLDETTICFPGEVRVPKATFLEFVRYQLFLRGFGSCGGDQGRWTIRALRPALARCGVPPKTLALGDDDLDHAEVFVPSSEKSAPGGVVVNLPAVEPGVLLAAGPGKGEATLLDRRGQTLRSWKDPEGGGGRWEHVTPLRDGGLLCVDPSAEELLRLGPDGKLRWRLALAVHHRALELADGRFLVLSRLKLVSDIRPVRPMVEAMVTVVSADGQVLTQHSLNKLVQVGPSALALERPADLDDLPSGYCADLLHACSLARIDDGHVAAEGSPFQPGRVLVTLRNLDRIVLLDLAQEQCVWSFGHGRLRNPHDARFLPDGRILVLDGLDAGGGARVLVLDPVNEKVEWEYRAARHGGATCSGQGTLEPLANGNVLVGLPDEAFEVTRGGALVWRYRNPPRGSPGRLGPWWRVVSASNEVPSTDAPR